MAENDRYIRREKHDQRTEVSKQRRDANLPKEVFLVLGKPTRATASMSPWKPLWDGVDPVDDEARGRISLRCFRKVAGALHKGIQVGGRSVRAESEEPTDDDEVPRRPKRGAKQAGGSAERGREGKGKGKNNG